MNRDDMHEIANFAMLNFNVPPRDVPREAMWSRVRQARTQGAAPSAAARRGRFSLRIGRNFSWRGRGGWIALPLTAVAAAVLVALVDVRSPRGNPARPDFRASRAASELSLQNSYAAAGAALTRYSLSRDAWLGIVAVDDPATDAFRRTAITHLTRSEAFIAGFRTQTAGAATSRQARNTTRELLMTTRLLIGSPLAVRLQFKPIFQDLELVLVRMSLMTQQTFNQDREQIQQTIEKKKLLARMREFIPQTSTSNAN